MKDGIRTSELWLTVAQGIAGLVVAFAASKGVIGEADEAELVNQLAMGLLAVAGLVASGLAVGGYTKQRTELKKVAEKEPTNAGKT